MCNYCCLLSCHEPQRFFFSLKHCHLTNSICQCIVIPQISLVLISSHYPSPTDRPTEIYRITPFSERMLLHAQTRTCYLNGKLLLDFLYYTLQQTCYISCQLRYLLGSYLIIFASSFFFFGRYKQFSAASFVSPQGQYQLLYSPYLQGIKLHILCHKTVVIHQTSQVQAQS